MNIYFLKTTMLVCNNAHWCVMLYPYTVQKNGSFPLSIYLVNVNNFKGNFGFIHIY